MFKERFLQKWDVNVRGEHRVPGSVQKDGHDNGSQDELRGQFDAATHPLGIFPGDLEVIIHESERAQIHQRKQCHPHRRVGWLRPQQRGSHDAADDQHAAHRRRALFAAMGFKQLIDLFPGSHRLAELQRDQLADHLLAENDGKQKGGERGAHPTKGGIFEHAQWTEIPAENGKVIQHERVFMSSARAGQEPLRRPGGRPAGKSPVPCRRTGFP